MKAMTYDQYGPAEVLHPQDMPPPIVVDRRVLVRVRAASVNPVDWKIRKGELKFLTGQRLPRVPGIDFAGVVKHVGAGIDRFRVGDEVFGILNAITARFGSAAQYLVAKDSQMAHKPTTVSFLDAAAIPCAGLTAWHALRDLAQLRSGQRVLVNGASGGVGSFAVQIAQYLGAAVTGTCSADNMDFVRGLGADHVVDYRAQDVRSLADRFDAILDASATLSYPDIAHLLRHRGIYVSTLPTPQLVLRALTSFITPGKKAKIVVLNGRESIPTALTDLAGLMASGRLRAHVENVFPLEELPEAHRKSETGHARGKIGVQIS